MRSHPECGEYRRALLPRGRNDEGAQLVEFAVSLPLLVVFVVGIFDFSGAFTLKQKLTAAARDAARSAASLPATDLGSAFTPGSAPISVTSALQVVDNYLIAEKLNDCGLSSALASQTGLTWTYTSVGNGCPASGVTVIINRGYVFPRLGADLPANCGPQSPGSGINVVGTCVSVQYAYRWRFDRVITLLGLSNSLPGSLTTVAVTMNEN
jgi:Flp pilus assembly protein TadG